MITLHTARPTILLYVQNLLGIGHLRRAAAVARALVTAGMDV
ncbi:MAG: glycosyl transferase, partial [Alphaproteobacteria bacterium]|nr:glycosyl transferase [Alphaproteobacteria bacterium]